MMDQRAEEEGQRVAEVEEQRKERFGIVIPFSVIQRTRDIASLRKVPPGQVVTEALRLYFDALDNGS